MLEDCTMEKKPTGRPVQTPAKGVGTDSKKGQDGSNGKLFPKTSRRREANGATSSKYDPNRKPVPQKSKAIDKRPRPRGQYVCGKEDTKVMDGQDAEVGSVFMPGSKKQNLNHLLNFHYAPRDVASQWRSGGGQRWNSGGNRTTSAILALSTHRHKYNKEQYLQANCQFVVKADGDYSPYANNPDTLVDWDLVEQIRVQGPEVPSCPICLSPPVAAKMTRCGHVYCWPCILHYLALSDKTWRKCPICFEAVHRQDLKSVVALPRVACNIMEEIEMHLMCREKGSLVVIPVEDTGIPAASSNGKPPLVGDETSASAYSKLLLATPLQVLSILDREKAELNIQLSEEVGSPEVCFTEQAIELLTEREKELIKKNLETRQIIAVEDESNPHVACDLVARSVQPKSEAVVYASAFDNVTLPLGSSPNSPLPGENFAESGSDMGIPGSHEENSPRCRNESMSSEGLGSEEDSCWESNIMAEDLELTNQSRINSPLTQNSGATNKYYYFYQAADGQHIYLHSLNVRMLERGFGSLENCPRILRGRVLEKEAGSMTLELRKRLRCFQHLPLACQFEVAEIQLHPPLVNKETLNFFKDQLENRRRRRQKRAREEQKWEKRAARVEAQKWGHYPSARIRIDSHHQFPECGMGSSPETTHHPSFLPSESLNHEEEVVEASSNSQSCSPVLTDAFDGLAISGDSSLECRKPLPLADAGNHMEKESVGCWGSSTQSSDSGTMSFAQMLREGKGRPSSTETDGLQSYRKKTEGKDAILMEVASKAAAAAKRRPTSRRGAVSDESDGDGADGQAPAFNQSFGDAIALALQRKENISEEAAATQGKKKKKQKQKLLFNTNMAFIGK